MAVMTGTQFIQGLGMISAVAMPLFDIPLMMRVVRRKSSEDISLVWLLGIEFCILGMFPASLLSPDIILRVFGAVNVVLFTATTAAVLWYHPEVRKSIHRPLPKDRN